MKYIFFYCILFTAAVASAQTTIIVVRHAEKDQTSTSRDPELSADGIARLRILDRMFSNVTIDHVYSTPYKRTRQTVSLLAERNKRNIEEYDPAAQHKLAALLKASTDKTVVVAGHSNTVPAFLNLLIGENKFVDLPESEYDNLYIVTLHAGKTKVICLKYGEASNH